MQCQARGSGNVEAAATFRRICDAELKQYEHWTGIAVVIATVVIGRKTILFKHGTTKNVIIC